MRDDEPWIAKLFSEAELGHVLRTTRAEQVVLIMPGGT